MLVGTIEGITLNIIKGGFIIMELVNIKGKTEIITNFDNALEFVEKDSGRDLAYCIYSMHKAALKQQEEDNPYCYTQDEFNIQAESYISQLQEITDIVDELQEYLWSSKKINRSKIYDKLKHIRKISSDY